MPQLSIAALSLKLRDIKARWSASDNPIVNLQPEVRKRLLGREVPKPSATLKVLAMAGTPAFDPAVDWRNRRGGNHITPVKDQVSCGSCVSFCTVGVTEAMAHIEKNLWLDLSEADQHFCSVHGASCGGWNDADAFGQIHSRGVCDEAAFPYATAFPNNDPRYYYSHSEPPHPTCRLAPDRNARAVKITNITNLGTSQANIKNYLTNVGPVSCSFAVYDDFYSYSSGVYHKTSNNLEGYHCVMVVGYSEAEQCWICKNSWGTAWGMAGYFKIAYGECTIDNNEKIGVAGVLIPNTHREVNKATLGETSSFAPALCQMNGRIYIAWTGTGNNRLNIMSSADGMHFANKVTLGDTALGSPALAAVNGKLYIAWTGTDARHSLNVMSSTDGVNFGGKVTLGDTSFTNPALAGFNNKLYLAWTGTDARHSLNVMSSADGTHFTNKVTLGDTSFTSPSLAVSSGRLYLGWTGTDAAHSLNVMSSADGISFMNKITFPERSDSGTAVSTDGTLVWIGWTGVGNLQLNFMSQPSSTAKLTLGETAIGMPALSYPYFAWTGTDAQHHLNVAKIV